jgi:hypothetical protein
MDQLHQNYTDYLLVANYRDNFFVVKVEQPFVQYNH